MIDFYQKTISPMLIGADQEAFDSPEYVYEIKWDGERCIAYLDPEEGTELRNKRNLRMLPKVPELMNLHRQVRTRCILDGELMVLKNGRPDFYEIQKRSLMTSPFKINLASKRFPASFIPFDILLYGGEDVTLLPLMERKQYLERCIQSENGRMALSRYTEQGGIAFFDQAAARGLEGIVAKRRDSIYIEGKRTKDWIKMKRLLDEDFAVCGYVLRENGTASLFLGQYENGQLAGKGRVTFGVGGEDFKLILTIPVLSAPPFPVSDAAKQAVWIEPVLSCKVKFMDYTASGGMRQPVFKGLRLDKAASDCVSRRP